MKEEILETFDRISIGQYDYKDHKLLDLENGYLLTGTSKIHLYREKENWAIVFEVPVYDVKQSQYYIDLYFFGNAVDFSKRLSNSNIASVKSNTIFRETLKKEKRIQSSENEDIGFNTDYEQYELMGIISKTGTKESKFPQMEDIFLYLQETEKDYFSINETKIKSYFKSDVTKILKIEEFCYYSINFDEIIPSSFETYILIADVISNNNAAFWKPKMEPNNHWANWENGHL